MPPLLELRKLTKRFGQVTALNEVSFDLHAGEVLALCGENGAGKSTLIKCLTGIYPTSSCDGEIVLDGRPVLFRSLREGEQTGIVAIHQELALVREMTVAENIFLGAEPTQRGLVDWNAVYSRTRDLLNRFNLELDPSTRVEELGIGQQQLVEIAKALSRKARILLLDEPTAALAESETARLLDIVHDLRRRGISCIYISHRLEEVLALADRVTVLRDGRSVASLTKPTRPEIVRHMVGRDIEDYFPRRRTDPGEVLLKVENLAVAPARASGKNLEGISFDVRRGEVFGIGGLMGSGRTELLMHLFGAYGTRTHGSVSLLESPFSPHSPREAIARGLALVSEDRKRSGIIPGHPVGFNLSLAAISRLCGRWMINANLETQANQSLIAQLRVRTDGQEAAIDSLSGGNQQKVLVGRALLTEPDLILFDEPTRGVDVGAKVEIYEIINYLTSIGKAVLLVSSELPELMGMSDQILILANGRSGGTFHSNEARQESLLEAALSQ